MTDDPKMKKWQGYFPDGLIAEVTAWGKARGHMKTSDAMRVLIRRALDADRPAEPSLPPKIVEALAKAIAVRGEDDVLRALTPKGMTPRLGEMIPEPMAPADASAPKKGPTVRAVLPLMMLFAAPLADLLSRLR